MLARIFPIIFIIVFSLAGCTESDAPNELAPIKEIQETEVLPEIKDTTINNENATERLLAYAEKNPETIVLIHTTLGELKIRLFKETPLHRANFIMLAKSGYFDGTIFTRVIKNFIAQGGSPYSYVQVDLQKAIGRYTVPSEMSKKHIHKKGAICAARDYPNNPEKRSDPYSFYLVEGTRFSDETLDMYERKNDYHYSAAQRKYYINNPGAAHLDGQHTVFGEIISGFSVVPKITSVDTDKHDWPVDDIFIEKIEVIN